MSVDFRDISYAQGLYDMASDPNQFVMIKMSGGDDGLYYDRQAARNYNNATAAGKITGLYHFYAGGDPLTEANFFIGACSPLGENDIMAIDVERSAIWDPQTDPNCVEKVREFVNQVHAVTGLWCWVYLNRSTRQMYDWSPVLNNCALWIAAPDVSFDADIPNIGVYMAQQGPIVDGVDIDRYFGDYDSLKRYTFGGANAQPTTTTTTTQAPPEPTTTSTTTTTTVPPDPDPTTTTTTTETTQQPPFTTTTTTTETTIAPDPGTGLPTPGFWAGVFAAIGAFVVAIWKFLTGEK